MSMSHLLSFITCAMLASYNCGCSSSTPKEEESSTTRTLEREAELAALELRFSAEEAALKNQLAAAHILIMHEGSDRCPPNVTRTKEEALTLVQEVAVKTKTADVDFAALAMEYSDCSSSPQGGDLGVFAPEAMVKPFSDATKALEIGDVSEPIETQFGYHIILRREP